MLLNCLQIRRIFFKRQVKNMQIKDKLKLGGAAESELSAYDAVFITGGSSGIGEAFLKCALKHCRGQIFNISRTAPKADLLELGNFRHIECDLCDAGQIDALMREIRKDIWDIQDDKNPLRVLLINNAGFGLYGAFPEPDIARNMKMLSLNVCALTRLCAEFLPIIKSGKGSIINISSVAAYEPCPILGVYAATKSYVKSFSLSLSYELKKFGCKCLCVCPGPTSSNFFRAAGFDTPPLAGTYGHKPHEVAAAAYKALARGKVLKVVGLQNSLLTFLTRFLPERLLLEISGRVLERVRKQQ